MAKQTRDKETDNLPEYIYCKMFVLTNNKTASYIFANKGKVTTNPNSLKTLAAKYHNTNQIQKILPVVENQMEQQMKNYLTNKGYVLFSPQDRLNGKMQKYVQNYSDSPATYEVGIVETAQLQVPPVVGHVLAEFSDAFFKDVQTFLALAAAHELADARHQHVHGSHRPAVVVEAHVERLDLLGIVGDDHGRAELLLGDVAFVLRLEVLAPRDGVLECLAR